MTDGYKQMMDAISNAVTKYTNDRDLEQRARIIALEAQLVWEDRLMTDALTVRIVDILRDCDRAATGELTQAELTAAFDATAKRWNAKAKKTGGATTSGTTIKGKANGKATNGAHLS